LQEALVSSLTSSLGRLGRRHETLATATPNPALLAAPPQELVTGTTHTAGRDGGGRAPALFWCALQSDRGEKSA
jgi:hypothetical protein